MRERRLTHTLATFPANTAPNSALDSLLSVTSLIDRDFLLYDRTLTLQLRKQSLNNPGGELKWSIKVTKGFLYNTEVIRKSGEWSIMLSCNSFQTNVRTGKNRLNYIALGIDRLKKNQPNERF